MTDFQSRALVKALAAFDDALTHIEDVCEYPLDAASRNQLAAAAQFAENAVKYVATAQSRLGGTHE